jgi:hypothetical protein
LLLTGIAHWPKVQPRNSKEAEKRSGRLDKSAAELGARFSKKGPKRDRIFKQLCSFTFPYKSNEKLDFSQVLALK